MQLAGQFSGHDEGGFDRLEKFLRNFSTPRMLFANRIRHPWYVG
jgi:hypothetical protein